MTRVLVCDDHLAVRITYAEYLDAHPGLQVVASVGNGAEAVDACRETSPDIVVMDVRMPVMDGIEATRQIKASSPSTAVVLVSAYEEAELIESGRRAGADAFLLKGVSGAELASRILELAPCTP